MSDVRVPLPAIVSQDEWQASNDKQIEREKAHTKLRDALNAERRRMPAYRIDKDYVFTGPDGSNASLQDLFDGRRQLILYHFMLGPNQTEGCDGCSMPP